MLEATMAMSNSPSWLVRPDTTSLLSEAMV